MDSGVRSGPPSTRGRRYEVVARALAEEIRAGPLADAVHLPSERELVARFAVSRVTVRHALRALAEEGLLRAVPGRGWLVRAARLEEPESDLLSFSAAASARGLSATSTVLVARLREASFEEAESLAVVAGSPVFELERVRLLDGLPVAVDWCLLPGGPAAFLAGRDWRTASLYESLARAGCPPARADYVLQADAASAREAARLGISRGAPVLRASQLSFEAGGRPVQACRIVYRGDRYRYRATLGRRG